MKPTKGRTVIVKGMLSGDNVFDGTLEAAAIVSMVVQDTTEPYTVHLTAFPAMSAPKLYNDVPLYPNRDAAHAAGIGLAAYWPKLETPARTIRLAAKQANPIEED